MSPDAWRLIHALSHLGAALAFLLVGWRLGRESAGRPMFDFPVQARTLPDPAEEPDPWTEAALGRPSGARAVDSFETLGPPGTPLHGEHQNNIPK